MNTLKKFSALIKKRKAKVSKRGVYLQDVELLKTKFKVGSNYKSIIDTKNNKIYIIKGTGSTVSKRKINNEGECKPVIDIRKKGVLKAFEGCQYLHVEIYEDQIIVTGHNAYDKETKAKIVLPKSDLYQIESAFNLVKEGLEHLDIPLRVASLFSGAGMFDYPFHQDDTFEIVIANELSKEACDTYRLNIGDHVLNLDVRQVIQYISKLDVKVLICGSPCQGFSNSNRKNGGEDNENSKLVREFILAVKSIPSIEVFVLENVPQILGTRYEHEIKDQLSDFHIEAGVLDNSQFGGAQKRKRAFFIGAKIGSAFGKIRLPKPIKQAFKTVRDAFVSLHDSIANQLDFTIPKDETIERMIHVPQGGNFLDIPKEIRPNGQQSNLFRRLEWDKPSISLPNVRKSNILHPTENRILSVRECARLFDFPDHYQFVGGLSSRQQQVANGVPYTLGKAIMEVIKGAYLTRSLYV
nr:DNA cytosine methyltransferase [Anaerobacillus isosaccharinicus]QOY37681.1 DNA cytosine methyltransferase [Anaerobacillus isosaccharinicus]